MTLVRISRRLAREVAPLAFGPPVAAVYSPLEYARAPHETYLRRHGRPGCRVLLVGMNPGPWGMAQTGVPFGEVGIVRDWLGIEGPVHAPASQLPERPVLGFACRRSEVSGRRLWGWARDRFGSPERFFERFFVWNYCPLAFLEEGGRNRTPDKLPAAEARPLFEACDRALRAVARHLRPEHVVGIGRFAERRVRAVLEGEPFRLGAISHPSPASPVANRGWAARIEAELRALDIDLPDEPIARGSDRGRDRGRRRAG
jgi:single-strand selective monofunctional uracil DNA glycosylase